MAIDCQNVFAIMGVVISGSFWIQFTITGLKNIVFLYRGLSFIIGVHYIWVSLSSIKRLLIFFLSFNNIILTLSLPESVMETLSSF